MPNLVQFAQATAALLEQQTSDILHKLAEAAPSLEALVVANMTLTAPRDDGTYSELISRCDRLRYLDVGTITNEQSSHGEGPPALEWPEHRVPLKVVDHSLSPEDRFDLRPSVRISGENVIILTSEEEKAVAREAFLEPWICRFDYR